jgi:hypothetical protein
MDRVTAQSRAGVETSSLSLFGLKVFMDAHKPVTLEEGDRYPLGPPSFCAGLILRLELIAQWQTGLIPVRCTKFMGCQGWSHAR